MGGRDEAEFDAFHMGAARRVTCQLALLTGDVGQAEAAVAEAFRRCWLRWPDVRDLDSPEAWVRTTARQLTASRWRPGALTDRSRGGTMTPAPDDGLRGALGSLPEDQRVAVVLHHLADLSVEDIAVETGGPTSAVVQQLRAGLAALADLLTDAPRGTGSDRRAVSDPLSDLLHREAERVVVAAPAPAMLRRSARLRRRRLGLAAAACFVLVAAGAAQLAGPVPPREPLPPATPIPVAPRPSRLELPLDAAVGVSAARAETITIPASFRFAEERRDRTWRDDGAETRVERSRALRPTLPFCRSAGRPSLAARTASLRLRRWAPDQIATLQLVLHRNARAAAGVMARIRRALHACSRRTVGRDASETRLVWRATLLRVGDEGVVGTAGYTVAGRPVSGKVNAAVVRISNAVLVRMDFGAGLPGEPDPDADEVARAMRRNVGYVCALVRPCSALR